MAKPHLALIPFHSNSYPHRLFHPMPFTSSSLSNTCTTIHRFWSPLVFLQAGYMLFLELFDTVLMKSTKIHSPLQTLTHNLTLPSLQVKLPLEKPIIPISSEFHPNLFYPILYKLIWKPINQSSGGVVDDMAIHSLHNSPFTDLNTITVTYRRIGCWIIT